MSFIVLMSARRRGVGQQRHLAAVLHCHGDVTLVLAAVAADAAGTDLAAVGDELPQQRRVLVVDVGRLVLAELADLLLDLANGGLGHRVLQIQRDSERLGGPFQGTATSSRVVGKEGVLLQNGGSSLGPAGVAQGSLAPPPPPPPPPPPDEPKPPPPPPPNPPPPSPRLAFVTFAVA